MILDGMADDYEDVEQLYLSANREFAAERELDVQPPRLLVQTRVPLRDMMDEIAKMVRHGNPIRELSASLFSAVMVSGPLFAKRSIFVRTTN